MILIYYATSSFVYIYTKIDYAASPPYRDAGFRASCANRTHGPEFRGCFTIGYTVAAMILFDWKFEILIFDSYHRDKKRKSVWMSHDLSPRVTILLLPEEEEVFSFLKQTIRFFVSRIRLAMTSCCRCDRTFSQAYSLAQSRTTWYHGHEPSYKSYENARILSTYYRWVIREPPRTR